MIPIFTIFIILFIIILTGSMRKNSKAQKETEENFWQREQEANTTRKADISGLNYITIPSGIFPQEPQTETEKELQELSGKKILNLTGLSNTDLKLQYGVANLEKLSEYDSNFADLVVALSRYGQELYEADRIAEARKVLEYAVSIRADAAAIYTTLADIYQALGETDKLPALIDSAGELQSLSRNSIVEKLNTYLA